MKYLLVLTFLTFSALHEINGQCNPIQSCSSSTECAIGADDLSCRCSYLSCKDFGTEKCGGGCLTSSQCATWADGDESCTCSWWFECERESLRSQPGYELYAKTMMAIKKDKIQKRLAILTKEMKGMEDEMDERLRAL